MNDREIKGITAELLCQTEFIKRGYNVSIPISSCCVYDFIVDINNNLYKVQVKHSNKSKIGFSVSTTSSHLTSKGTTVKKYTSNDIDFICTYFDNNCYLISVKEVENRSNITLSLKNNWVNAHHLMIAECYLLDSQLNLIKDKVPYTHSINYIIQQINKNGIVIKEYNDVANCDICKDDLKKQSHISQCINGKRKTAYGYKWKRIEIASNQQ